MNESNKSIIHVKDLSGYFFERLHLLNSKSLCPLPEETLFYSSSILNKYSLSSEFYDLDNGRVCEKILGLKFLEASSKSRAEQKRIYKDIADTSLILTGFFADSIKTKIIDKKYYVKIGQMAYSKMYTLDEKFCNVPHFYRMMATSFEHLSFLINSLNNNDLLSFKEKESNRFSIDISREVS
jgi:hypothetical protein